MNNEFDLEQLASLLDSAINSDAPAVKKALSNFLMIAALCNTDDEDDLPRPFTTLLRDVSRLSQRVGELESRMRSFDSFGGGNPSSGYYHHNPVYDYSTISRLQDLASKQSPLKDIDTFRMPTLADPSTIFKIKSSKE